MQRNIFEGSEFLLFDINQNPIAYCKNSAIKINRNLSDVTTKDSEGWNDFINGIKSWSLDFEGLVSYDDTNFSTSYFLSKFKHSEPFFISFGIIQDDFKHTFWGEVAIESIEINSDNGEIVSYSGSLKGIGKLAFTDEGTPEQSGYIKTETDPYFRSSPAHSITNSNINNWTDAYNKTLNEVLFNTVGNTTTLNVKLRDGSIYNTSFNHIGGGNGGTILTGLTFNTTTGQLSVNNLSTSLEGRYQPLGSYVSQSYLIDNYYSNSQSDSRFATYNYVDTELANLVNSAPSTLDTLNELADALGNDPNFATTITTLIGTKANSDDVYSKIFSDGRYQLLENQRLSSSNNVVFNQITANSKLNIPSTSSNKYSIFVDEIGLGGTGSTIPVISYLNDLSDVTITSPVNGNVLMFNGAQWINSTVTSGTFNYNDLINKPDLSIYALTNGANASGNWNINIIGNASSATSWGGQSAILNSGYGTNPNYLIGYDNTEGTVKPFLKSTVQNWLNINDGSTLTNNISGTATNWGGYSNSFSTGIENSGDFTAVPMMAANGVFYNTSFTLLQTKLNVNNGATLNNNISGSAANSTRWNNYLIDLESYGTSLNFFLGYDGLTGKMMPFSSSQIKSSLSIDNGSTLNNNITGTAANWGAFSDIPASSVNGFLLGYNNSAKWAPMAASNVKSWLATSLQDVTSRGNSTTTGMGLGGDLYLNGAGRAIIFNGVETQIYESAGSINFYTNTLDRLTILSNGNVGIGTTSPGSKLDVLGNSNFNGDLGVGGKIYAASSSGDGSGWTTANIEVRGTNPGIGFHYPETYGAPLWMNGSGVLNWNGNGLNAGGFIYTNGTVDAADFIRGQRIVAGYDSGVAGSVNTDDFLRVSGNGGIWWASYGVGLENNNPSYPFLYSQNNTVGLRLATNGGVLRGYIAANSNNEIGFLNSSGDWSLRTDASGNAFATAKFEAPNIKATSKLEIPAKNSAGSPTGNHFSIWVEV